LVLVAQYQTHIDQDTVSFRGRQAHLTQGQP
jgi:hypothetical protein